MIHIWRHAEDQVALGLKLPHVLWSKGDHPASQRRQDKGEQALHERIDNEGDEEVTMPVERDHWQNGPV